MLTQKQHELLQFINSRIMESGVSPSFDEMKEALNLRSKSGIHRLITALEERGFLKRLPNRARALEVMRLPDDAASAKKPAPKFAPSVVAGNFAARGRGAPRSPTRVAALNGSFAAFSYACLTRWPRRRTLSSGQLGETAACRGRHGG